MTVQIPGVTRNIVELRQSTLSAFPLSFDAAMLPSGSLEGYFYEFKARRTLDQPLDDIYISSTAGNIVSLGPTDLNIVFQPSDTASLQDGDYFWEVRVSDPSGSVMSMLPYSQYGELFLLKSF